MRSHESPPPMTPDRRHDRMSMNRVKYPNTQLLIDGVGRDCVEGMTIAVTEPSTGAVIGTVAHATKSDLDAALASVERGFKVWSATSAFDRYKLMRKAAELLRERAGMIGEILTREQGKPVNEAKGEVLAGADII